LYVVAPRVVRWRGAPMKAGRAGRLKADSTAFSNRRMSMKLQLGSNAE